MRVRQICCSTFPVISSPFFWLLTNCWIDWRTRERLQIISIQLYFYPEEPSIGTPFIMKDSRTKSFSICVGDGAGINASSEERICKEKGFTTSLFIAMRMYIAWNPESHRCTRLHYHHSREIVSETSFAHLHNLEWFPESTCLSKEYSEYNYICVENIGF